jgi:hypothetical protein
MANVMRYRYGDTNPVMAAVDSGTVIEIGDLLYLDTDDAKPASALADTETEAGNQEAFHDKFLGVAEQQSRSGDTNPIRVATAGVFEFICPAETRQLGQLIGVDEASSGTALEDQTVDNVATANLAIGYVAKTTTTATVLVDIVSTVMRGGPQAMA